MADVEQGADVRMCSEEIARASRSKRAFRKSGSAWSWSRNDFDGDDSVEAWCPRRYTLPMPPAPSGDCIS